MVTIPQRRLRNDISEILRRAEAGESFTVTVNGRPVAQLGPPAGAPAVLHSGGLAELLAATPVDEGWVDDLAAQRAADRDAARDPWDR